MAPGREESDEGEGGRRGTLATMRHMFQGELVHKVSKALVILQGCLHSLGHAGIPDHGR